MTGEHSAVDPAATLEDVYRSESRRVLATLIHLLGDFDLAEDALQEAFAAAAVQWPRDGVPSNPRAWLVSTGRFKAIDALRRRSRSDVSLDALLDQFDGIAPGAAASEPPAGPLAAHTSDPAAWDYEEVGDDRLRLIFTCCHPVLQPDARVALTLREVCDLTTEEIARAFLIPVATLAQRIVRAKAKLREARVPFEAPSAEELPDRLDAVLQVIYLVFNEGYSASSGPSLTRPDLSGEAIRLGRLLLDLLPPAAPKGEPEAAGLLALMLLQESRRTSRTSPEGDLIPLEEQDRSLWDRSLIAEGIALAARALSSGRLGYYTLQAAIAAEHARAPSVPETDWPRIARLYRLLAGIAPSPVIELNRAVAVAMADGPEAGLALVDALLARGELSGYHLAYAVRADLCRRLGRAADARVSYGQALALAKQEAERRYLQRRLAELPAG